MSKRWFGSAGLVLALVLVVFLAGYYAGESPTGFAPQGARPFCGNGVVDSGEQCDDGGICTSDNSTPCKSVSQCPRFRGFSGRCAPRNGDGCDRSCRIETGRVPGVCGDGVLNLREECDDSNIVLGDGCSERCLSESSTWQCDDRDNWDGDEGEATTNIWLSSYVQTRRSSSERWALTDRDVCLGPNTLKEFYCHQSDDRPAYSEFNCEYGCSNGACNPLPCIDSDGNNILIRGSVTGVYRGSNNDGRGADPAVLGLSPSVQTYEDGCYGERVREMTCASNGFVSGSLRDCSSGQVCNDGRCTELPQTPPPPVLVETVCDGIDNDDDGVIDEGCDDDNDGVCDASMEFAGSSTCGAGIWVQNSNCCYSGGDCGDNNPRIRSGPWWGEICSDNLDNDCDDIVNEGCERTCDDIDNDGNGLVDDGCEDFDGDGYCPYGRTLIGTPAVCPNGGGDCNNGYGLMGEEDRVYAAAINPGAIENCFSAVDDNCNGQTNEGCAPFVCEDSDEANNPLIGGIITLTSANGQVLDNAAADVCVNSGQVNETICVNPTREWVRPYHSHYLGGVLANCPAGTTCSDPDNSTGSTPAVCS